MGIPVPAGITITTEVCTHYYDNNCEFPNELNSQILESIKATEKIMGAKFGDNQNPLLLSVRSGARQSMPGMMETVLNVGLTSKTIPALIKKTNNPRFVYDAYRRLIMMYADVVMEKSNGIEVDSEYGIRHKLESLLTEYKNNNNYLNDTDLNENDWELLSNRFKEEIKTLMELSFLMIPWNNYWEVLKPYSKVGMENVQLITEE